MSLHCVFAEESSNAHSSKDDESEGVSALRGHAKSSLGRARHAVRLSVDKGTAKINGFGLIC